MRVIPDYGRTYKEIDEITPGKVYVDGNTKQQFIVMKIQNGVIYYDPFGLIPVYKNGQRVRTTKLLKISTEGFKSKHLKPSAVLY